MIEAAARDIKFAGPRGARGPDFMVSVQETFLDHLESINTEFGLKKADNPNSPFTICALEQLCEIAVNLPHKQCREDRGKTLQQTLRNHGNEGKATVAE